MVLVKEQSCKPIIYNANKDACRYALQVCDTTLMTRADSLPGQHLTHV